MLWDGDIALPAIGKAGCCLNMSFPVAILISEIKNVKYNMLKLERREVECLRYCNNPDVFP